MSRYRQIMTSLIQHLPWEGLVGVEIGVNAGALSLHLLQNCRKLSLLYGIDPYRTWQPGDAYYDSGDPCARATDEEWKLRLSETHRRTDYHSHRYELLVKTSAEAVTEFDNNSLHFVIVDGDHTEGGVYGDCVAWWPKLFKSGMMIWHDYGKGGPLAGVTKAIDRFTEERTIYPHVEAECVAWAMR